jgi:DNA polymerase I-like protein with 3'-5' exonuclease and polymerase domains
VDKVTSDLRQIGKTIRHANNYSAGPGVLAAKLGIALAEAKKLMNKYHDQCPQLKLWHAKIRSQLEKTRTLTNLLGRKHRFFERWGDDLFRSAYAYVPQSTVGDLLNSALVDIYDDYGSEIDLYLQLHDAVYILSRIEDRAKNVKILRDCMLRPLTSSLGEEYMIDVDFSVGASWGEMEEIDDPNQLILEAA